MSPPSLLLRVLAVGFAITGCSPSVGEDPGSGSESACGPSCEGCCLLGRCVARMEGCGGRSCDECARCNPQTCSGCCDGSRCIPEEEVSGEACGFSGRACVTCAEGAGCSSGRCEARLGESCLGRSCVKALQCFADAWRTDGFCRADCGATGVCPEGQTCSAGGFCFTSLTPESEFVMTIEHATVDDASELPLLVACIVADDHRTCTPATHDGHWRTQVLQRTFRVPLWVMGTLWRLPEGSTFSGCEADACAAFDAMEEKVGVPWYQSSHFARSIWLFAPDRDWQAAYAIETSQKRLVLSLVLLEEPHLAPR